MGPGAPPGSGQPWRGGGGRSVGGVGTRRTDVRQGRPGSVGAGGGGARAPGVRAAAAKRRRRPPSRPGHASADIARLRARRAPFRAAGLGRCGNGLRGLRAAAARGAGGDEGGAGGACAVRAAARAGSARRAVGIASRPRSPPLRGAAPIQGVHARPAGRRLGNACRRARSPGARLGQSG